MQVQQEYAKRARRLEALMGDHLGLNQGALDVRVKRGKRWLPAPVRRDLLLVAEAAHLSHHPRIAPTIDRRAVVQAYKRAVGFLRGPVPADQRKGRMIGAVAALAINLLLVFVLVLAALYFKDFL